MPHASELRKLLTNAKIKGRSAAKSHAQMLELCKQHHLLAETPELPELPLDILRKVFAIIIDQGIDAMQQGGNTIVSKANSLYTTLVALSQTCKTFQDILPENHDCWRTILRAFASSGDHSRDANMAQSQVIAGGLNVRRALQLVTGTGCESCGCGRTRKVHWPFFKRWCRTCLESETVSDYRLMHDYHVERKVFAHLPFVQAELYARRVGSYTLNFYLIDQVVGAFNSQTTKEPKVESLQDIRQIALDREARRAAEKIVERENIVESFLAAAAAASTAEKLPPPEKSPIFKKLLDHSLEHATQRLANNEFVNEIVQELHAVKLHTQVQRWVREIKAKGHGNNDGICWTTAVRVAMKSATAIIAMNSKSINSSPRKVERNKAWFEEHVWASVLPDLQKNAAIVLVIREKERQRWLANELRMQQQERDAKERRIQHKMVKNNGDTSAIVAIPAEAGKFKCPVCPGHRTFLFHGLCQHAMDVHGREVQK